MVVIAADLHSLSLMSSFDHIHRFPPCSTSTSSSSNRQKQQRLSISRPSLRCSSVTSSSSPAALAVKSAIRNSNSTEGGVQWQKSSLKTSEVAPWGGGAPSGNSLSLPARRGSPTALLGFRVDATITETAGEGLKWWERGGAPNLADVHSTEEFVGALCAAGDKLVVTEFYATWCGSCRALFPKFCQIANDNSDVSFLKVNFDENKPMCKSLNVKVLPFFHIYRGSQGRVDAFSCSLSKIQRLKDAIAKHHDCVEDCVAPEELGEGFVSLMKKKSD